MDARAAEIAALDTRRAKRQDIDGPSLREQWRTRAAALDFGPDAINAFLTATGHGRRGNPISQRPATS